MSEKCQIPDPGGSQLNPDLVGLTSTDGAAIHRPALRCVLAILRNPAESGHLFRTIPDTVPAQSGQASG